MKKQKTFITFGFDHYHIINGIIFDKDCVCVINDVTPSEGREKAFEYFGNKFCFEYPEKYFPVDTLDLYYPRGLINLFEEEK